VSVGWVVVGDGGCGTELPVGLKGEVLFAIVGGGRRRTLLHKPSLPNLIN
jgi:hypothetical protein